MCHLIEDAVNVLGTKNPKKGQFIEALKGVREISGAQQEGDARQ